MPEYLAPGVYIEEVSFRSKSIEGVPTSTTGFVGLARTARSSTTADPTTVSRASSPASRSSSASMAGWSRWGFPGRRRARRLPGPRRPRVLHQRRPAPLRVAGVHQAQRRPARCLTRRGRGRRHGDLEGALAGSFGNVVIDVKVMRSRNIAFEDPNFGNKVQAKGVRKGAIVEIINGGDCRWATPR